MTDRIECTEDNHVGPLRYDGEEEDRGTGYNPDYQKYVILECRHCYKTIKELSVYEVADKLNKILDIINQVSPEVEK